MKRPDALTIGRRIRQLRTDARHDARRARRGGRSGAEPAVDDRERQARAEAHAAAGDRARARRRRSTRCSSREPLDERATLEIALERAMQRADVPGARHRAVPHRQDACRRGAPGDARAAGRDRAAARRARGDARGGAAGERRAAPPHAHAGQLLRRARGAGRGASSTPSTTRAARSRSARHPTSPPTSASRCTTCPTCRRPPAASPTSRTGGCTCRAGCTAKGDPRTAVLQALVEPHPRAQRAAQLRGVPAPARRDELPHRRAADPRGARRAVPAGREGARAISIEDLRDAYSVSYETAAHRFTNLATGTSASRCTSSRCTSRARSRRRTRTTT